MAFRTKKISQMDPKGANLASTDLLEISELVSGSYVTKSITGAEIIASVPPTSVEWGDIGGTLSSQTDLNTALSGKVPTTRTLTINGTTQDLSADRTFTISTGITIGTTAITSGTVGRVLFQGSGNVVSQSANLFWDATNNFLGLGGTPTRRIDVISDGTNWVSGVFAGVGGTQKVVLGNLSGVATIGGHNQTLLAWAPLAINSGGGNVLIGTTTDAGFKLDVNGTARTGNLTTGIINASNNFVGNSTANQGFVGLGLGSGEMRFLNGAGGGFFFTWCQNSATNIPPTERMRLSSNNNLLIGTATDAGFKLDVNGTARVSGAITGTSTLSVVGDIYLNHPSGGGSTSFITDASACYIVQNSSRSLQIGYAGNYTFRLNNSTRTIGVSDSGPSPTLDASAILTLGSTTRGFLPPRMTTTQKNAIASPVAGLMVYDTTLNVISFYNGTMWL